MLADFPVTVDHAQVVVYTQDRVASGLLWSDDHVAQGFAWSRGYVSFGVPDHDGEVRIRVELVHGKVLDPQALWAVQVPFSVNGPVQVGTLFNTHDVEVPAGSYNLTYQALAGVGDYAYILLLSFSPSSAPQFQILKTGGEITADAVLRRDAEPAR